VIEVRDTQAHESIGVSGDREAFNELGQVDEGAVDVVDLGCALESKLRECLNSIRLTEEGGEDVAGDRRGAVAVAAVVDGERDAVAELVSEPDSEAAVTTARLHTSVRAVYWLS
jgi:hypothetical protein